VLPTRRAAYVRFGQSACMGRRAETGRLLLILGWAAWMLCVLAAAAGVLLTTAAGDLNCLHRSRIQGDSNYGDVTWSWLPLGPECTWTEESNGVDDFQGAAWGPTLFVAALLVTGGGIGYAHFRLWRTRARAITAARASPRSVLRP
jgi:hypothetical protein